MIKYCFLPGVHITRPDSVHSAACIVMAALYDLSVNTDLLYKLSSDSLFMLHQPSRDASKEKASALAHMLVTPVLAHRMLTRETKNVALAVASYAWRKALAARAPSHAVITFRMLHENRLYAEPVVENTWAILKACWSSVLMVAAKLESSNGLAEGQVFLDVQDVRQRFNIKPIPAPKPRHNRVKSMASHATLSTSAAGGVLSTPTASAAAGPNLEALRARFAASRTAS